jgi:hypothetical protein
MIFVYNSQVPDKWKHFLSQIKKNTPKNKKFFLVFFPLMGEIKKNSTYIVGKHL